MKILHTADWHLNTALGRVDLSPHINDGLEQIARLLDEHQVDVMVVAGDLFSERSRPEQIRQAVAEMRRLFLPFLERGGTILAISGNHDSEIFFDTLRDVFALAAPLREEGKGGRFYLTANPDYVRLRDKSGLEVQFALMPYPTPRCYLRGEAANYTSLADKHRKVQDGFKTMLQTLRTQKIDDRLPSVLVSHVHVAGAQGHTLYKISETDDVIFDPSQIPTEWAYVAYGHIHKPGEAIMGSSHVRYSGSIARLDAAERDDVKSVVLVEVEAMGRVGEPVVVPLRATPFYQVVINDPEVEVPFLTERYPDAESALVHYTLHWRPGHHNLQTLQKDIEKVFPRWYGRSLQQSNVVRNHALISNSANAVSNDNGANPTGADAANTSAGLTRPAVHDVAGTVRNFLDTRFKDAPERQDVLSLADQLLATEDWK